MAVVLVLLLPLSLIFILYTLSSVYLGVTLFLVLFFFFNLFIFICGGFCHTLK